MPMELAFTLIICVLSSFVFTWLAKRLNASVIIGLITAGLVLGSSYLQAVVIEPNQDAVVLLGDVGLIFLMFLTGMEVSWSNFRKEGRDAAVISLSAALTPFFLSVVVFYLVFGFPLLVALTIGISMSITAEAANARVMLELGKLKTRIGSLIVGAGLLDDVLGIALFVAVGYAFAENILTREFMVLFISIAAFFAGILVNHLAVRRQPGLETRLEGAFLSLIVPFFFISMGIDFSLQSLTLSPLLAAATLAVAIAGKIAGSMLAKPAVNLGMKQLYLVGWGMNARGAIGLAIAFIAFKAGLLDTGVYSALVIMSLATTLIFPFFLKRIIRGDPGIME
jgi:Kef-type K+ transport system membrane component KefB